MPAVDVAGEFETIRRLFAPLAHPEWGRGLTDDVAVVPSKAGHDLVLTKDAIVEGVHFLSTDPLDTVAKKLLRVNLSDLAAKGAEPFGYLLACHWSGRCGWPERKAFVDGLRADQKTFGIALLGGDTVVTPGPASFSISLLGWTPKGRTVGRAGARPGDLVFVTGAIGDGWLGLQRQLVLRRPDPALPDADAAHRILRTGPRLRQRRDRRLGRPDRRPGPSGRGRRDRDRDRSGTCPALGGGPGLVRGPRR